VEWTIALVLMNAFSDLHGYRGQVRHFTITTTSAYLFYFFAVVRLAFRYFLTCIIAMAAHHATHVAASE
jgi:hypothetical protein